MEKELYIFDADGTLIDRDSGEWLPNVREKILGLPEGSKKAVATNQGGPACRDAGWDWSDKYPTLEFVENRYNAVASEIGAVLYMALMFVDRNGKEYLPKSVDALADIRVPAYMRKPNPGMLLLAMNQFGVSRDAILFVGDSEADGLAAKEAGIDFVWAEEFFGWEKQKTP